MEPTRWWYLNFYEFDYSFIISTRGDMISRASSIHSVTRFPHYRSIRYALLGLAQGSVAKRLILDYSLPPNQVYVNFAKRVTSETELG